MEKRLKLLGLICALLATGAAQAQSSGGTSYPVHAIHWILPGAPGSTPDVVARIVGENLATKLGQPVIV